MVFFDWLETTSELTSEEKGRLIDAIVAYATGKGFELPGNERFLFPAFRAQVDRDKAAYENVLEQRRKAGSLGGKQKQANATRAKQNIAAPSTRSEYKDNYEDDYYEKFEEEEKEGNSVVTLPRFFAKFDGNWRHSERARAATAQILVDAIVAEGLPCASFTNLQDTIADYLSAGLTPEIIYQAARENSASGFGAALYAAAKGVKPR